MVYLHDPKLPLDAVFAGVHTQSVEAIEKLVRTRAEVDNSVRQHIERSNRYAVTHTNRSRREVVFAVDDLGLLSTVHLPLPPPLIRKLTMKWLGPLPVIERVGAVA